MTLNDEQSVINCVVNDAFDTRAASLDKWTRPDHT